jgi:type I restriction enzyme S subunit
MENSVPPAQETTLAEIANIGSGLALGKRNGAQKLVERPYLRVANVQRGRIDIGDVRRVQVSVADAERFRLQPGDILMNEGGDRDKLGRGAVWTGEVPDCIHQNHVFRVRLLDANYPPDYVSLYANEAGQAYFNENATQTTNLASISKAKLSRMPIRIPHASEANEILRIVSGGDRFLGALNENIGLASNRLLSLHGALSRRAFSGKLLFQPVEEESRDAPLVDRPISASRRRKPKKAKVDRRTMMDKLFDAVASWPKDGLTFEEIRTLFPGDYESLKDAVFDSLSGDLPSLVQRYDEAAEVMRFMRKAP